MEKIGTDNNLVEMIYLTPQEVCKYLRISRSLLYYWLNRNVFVTPIKFGKFTRFVKTEIDEWMLKKRKKIQMTKCFDKNIIRLYNLVTK